MPCFGLRDNGGGGIYCVKSWLDGETLSDRLSGLNILEQYQYGKQVAKLLKKINSIPVSEELLPLSNRGLYGDVNELIDICDESTSVNEAKKVLVRFLRERKLLESTQKSDIRPQTFLFGDFHSFNIIVKNTANTNNDWENLALCDLETCHWGDVWTEFANIMRSEPRRFAYVSGLVHGYFDGEPPCEFWQKNAFDTATLSLFVENRDNVDFICTKHVARVLSSYANFSEADTPYWYLPLSKVKDEEFMTFLSQIHRIYFARQTGFCRESFYQGFEPLHIYGLRGTRYRFNRYGLERYLSKEHSVLDIACNCGFMSLYTSYHVKRVLGVEIDKSLVEIARTTAEYLSVDNCEFTCCDFNLFKTDEKFDFIYSFAAHHWIGMAMDEYGQALAKLLKPGGMVLLESHLVRDSEAADKFQKIIDEFSHETFVEIGEGDMDDYLSYPRKFKILKLL